MKCGKCNETVAWRWRYCPYCAAKLEKAVFSRVKSSSKLVKVCGRIIDHRGDPVVSARVSLMQVTYIRGDRSSLSNSNYWNIPGWDSNQSVFTDSRGFFTISFEDYIENRLRKYGLYFQIPWQYPASGVKSENILQNPAPVTVDVSGLKCGRVDIGTLVAQKGGAIRIKLTDENDNYIQNEAGIFIFKDRETSGDGGQINAIEDGIYISNAYPAGSYGVKITKNGYRTFIRRGIAVYECRITDVSVRLDRIDQL